MERYGVRGIALNFFQNYLSNRQQFVAINNSYSNKLVTNISVPQGSVLGPLLYLTYVNEIQNLSTNFIATSFADDCTLSFAGHSTPDLLNICNHDLKIFKTWSDANRLTINIEKTNCMLISNLIDYIPNGFIKLDDIDLNFISDTRYLAVIIDDKLKFDKHIEYICKKI